MHQFGEGTVAVESLNMTKQGQSQGFCETTNTERFFNVWCAGSLRCPTYPENLGPCKTFEEGSNGRCVYCDHLLKCHQQIGGDRV